MAVRNENQAGAMTKNRRTFYCPLAPTVPPCPQLFSCSQRTSNFSLQSPLYPVLIQPSESTLAYRIQPMIRGSEECQSRLKAFSRPFVLGFGHSILRPRILKRLHDFAMILTTIKSATKSSMTNTVKLTSKRVPPNPFE